VLHVRRVFKWRIGIEIIVNYVVFWVIGFKEYQYGLFSDSFNSTAG